MGTDTLREPAPTLMDAVASLGGIPLEADAWGIDVGYSGSQKCLSVPPGLAPITFSPAARAAREERASPPTSFYLEPDTIGGLPIECDKEGNPLVKDGKPVYVKHFKEGGRIRRQAAQFDRPIPSLGIECVKQPVILGDDMGFRLVEPEVVKLASIMSLRKLRLVVNPDPFAPERFFFRSQ